MRRVGAQIYDSSSSIETRTTEQPTARRILQPNNTIGITNAETSSWDAIPSREYQQDPHTYYVSSNRGGREPRGAQETPRIVENIAQNRPHFQTKVVCLLDCKHCETLVCKRGMKAILLSDLKVRAFLCTNPLKV